VVFVANYEQIAQLIDRYDRAVDSLEQQVIERVNAAMDTAFRDIERELRRTYPDLQNEGALATFALKTAKFNNLKALLDGVLPEAQRAEIEALYQEALQLASDAGIDLANNLIDQIDPSYPLETFSGVPVEAIAAQARDGVRRLYRYPTEFATQASAIVETGLGQGWGTAKTARQLRQALGTTKSKAETIARTEVMSAYNDAAKARYAEAGISYLQWIVAPSETLCSFCLARNMRVYEAKDVIMPAHPRCRCTVVPWLGEWQEKGFTDDAWAKEYRETTMAEAKADGIKPNYGPTYWEKKNAGMETAPTPVWSP